MIYCHGTILKSRNKNIIAYAVPARLSFSLIITCALFWSVRVCFSSSAVNKFQNSILNDCFSFAYKLFTFCKLTLLPTTKNDDYFQRR